MTGRRAVATIALAAALAGCGSRTHPAAPPTLPPAALGNCDRYAAPSGHDGAAGTRADPLRTPQELADRLAPGQTGCLRAGSYPGVGADGYVVRFDHGGRPGQPLSIRSAPGEVARLQGVVWIPAAAGDVTLSQLEIDDPTSFAAGGQITVQVNGRDAVLDRLDITSQGNKTCVVLGDDQFGQAVDTVIRDSTIHDCGSAAHDLRDQGIYVSDASGARITGNTIYAAGGYGIQLYPAAMDTTVTGNVITGNGGGIILGGQGEHAASGNRISGNVVTASQRDYNVAIYWPAAVGHDNHVTANCLNSGSPGNIEPGPGYVSADNVDADPGFADAAAHDFRLARSGTCASVVAR